jgi:hypothetical protein
MEQTLRQKVEKRAFELFLARGGQHGYHMEDWLKAEHEILGSGKKAEKPKVAAAPKRR